MNSQRNKTVFITGGTKGIGKATAFKFAEKGANVVICSRNEKDIQQVIQSLKDRFPKLKCLGVVCDLSNVQSILDCFNEIDIKMGPIDILINNGAVGYRTPLLEISPDQWDHIFNINVKGSFFCAKEAMSRMIKDKNPGIIINMSSLGGIRSTEKFKSMTPYVASKFAICGLTEALAVEGKPYGIRVNAIAPGAVNTEMLQKAAPELKTETQPEDIADLILSLCENSTRSLTGTILEVYSNA